jgi:phospholipid/cholesterol/gamma-HCH transport system substrate-binding protein
VRRPVVIAAAVVAIVVVLIVIVASGGDDGYRVRAIFDNASTLVPGEDVKVAGAPVGVVESMDVADENKAAVVLRVDNGQFTPFKTDAKCIIRLQGLIGERFVECEPGSAAAPKLRTIEEGPGKGQKLLPVENTSSPVDLDLVNDIMRLPYRERLAIVLSEFGTGLAGRGDELNEVIHRANPALRETEKVIKVLADQNRVLGRLARDSDTALAPLAREREHVAGFVVHANDTATASAERSDDIRTSIDKLPQFLAQLRPLMADLEGFDDQATPVVADLGAAAPSLARLIKGQGELATAARKSFPSLGDSLARSRPALIGSRPLIRNLGRFAKPAKPASKDLDLLTASLDETGGPERIMDFLYYSTLAINGFDSIGHYLRAGLVVNTCSNYTLTVSPGCNATFFDSSAAAANAPAPTEPASAPPAGTMLKQLLGTGESAAQRAEREHNLQRLHGQDASPPGLGPREPALDFLLGDDR